MPPEAKLESVQRTLAHLRAPPQPQQTAQKTWHQHANDIIGTEHSRCTPTTTNMAGCMMGAHGKKVTLQAYVLHPQRKYRIKT